MELPPRHFLSRHPLLRDALLWSIPAVLFGAVLRLLFLSYSPYAYWGSDSNSYFSFTELFLTSGKISLYDKRRYVYPLLLCPITLLPGAMLKWLAVLQHGLGILTLIPLAYCVRKSFTHWRWLVVPVTVVYAGIPLILWYEHELLAENVFFAAGIWTCAGWMAWSGATNPVQRRQLWWYFFVPFAVLLLTKPAGRFFIPGFIFALVCIAAWRYLRWKEWASLAAAAGLTFTIGQDSQGAWLLYTSSFPLTRLDTPLHAEYKEEIRDMVTEARARVDQFKMDEDRAWKRFLKNPEEQSERPLWQALGRDRRLKSKVYKELALEGIKARPDLFLFISFEKILSSANPNDFKNERFRTDYFPRKFEHLYERYREESPRRLQMILGLPRKEPLPPYDHIRQMIAPAPDSRPAAWLYDYTGWFSQKLHLIEDDEVHVGDDEAPLGSALRPAGWCLIAGIFLSFLPRYFRRLGVWTVIMGGYLIGVFLVGSANARFFGSAWPLVVLLIALPFDVLLTGVARMFTLLRPGDGAGRESQAPAHASQPSAVEVAA